MSNTNELGAFSAYTCEIDKDQQAAFDEALEGLVGVGYNPVAVSQQVVAGMNYHFFCNTKLITARPRNGAAIVSIYKPLKGEAHITNIKTIS